MQAQKALVFATEKHSGQKRRSGEQYIEHPKRVAQLVGDNENMICIALLHDTLEDTNTTYEELVLESSLMIGEVIADGVKALTNDKTK
jgi:(p)ppGpp synthase/HD superfamily hydrolase